MRAIIDKWKVCLRDKRFVHMVVVGAILLLASLVVNYMAAIYATERASNFVDDIVLSNIRVFNLDELFVYGPVLLCLFVAYLSVNDPKRIPFVLKSVALFVLVRSFFVILTHLGPYPAHASLDGTPNLLKMFTSGNDLFFSGHTGLPFLMALVFWDNRLLASFFTATAVFFGAVVLLAHFHYSIDVLSAFFITYTIFHIASVFFEKDKKMFSEGLDSLTSPPKETTAEPIQG